MVFRKLDAEQQSIVSYEVMDGSRQAGRFSYRIDGTECHIGQFHLNPGYEDSGCLKDMLGFIEYKSWTGGASAMYLEISERNHLLVRQIKAYGFRQIDLYPESGRHGEEEWKCVFQYSIPEQ